MVDESLEPAQWGDPVGEGEIAAVEDLLGVGLPQAWRDYLRRDRWLRQGQLESGDYLRCFDPHQAREQLDAWGEAAQLHPGIYFLGGDASRNLYCIDLRDPEPAVQLTDIASSGWHDTEPLCASVDQFVDAIRAGTFRAYPDE
jgi:hypothetical protein